MTIDKQIEPDGTVTALERMADYLVVLSHGQVQVAGEAEGLQAA